MNKKKWVSSAVLALTFGTSHATSPSWPKLVGGQNYQECRSALHLAQITYRSTAVHLWEPQPIPPSFGNKLVLGPQAVDLSGGDALDADAAMFAKLPNKESPNRSVYWQAETPENYRLVVEESNMGWRGDKYTTRTSPASLTSTTYASATNRLTAPWIATMDQSWRPPLVFKNERGKNLWLIFVGEPYTFLSDWAVYLPVGGRLEKGCRIQFRPNVKQSELMLPAAVRKLADLADQTLGLGENEGTLQPTAGIRVRMQHAWANMALRPWASEKPYNTRAEVDAGLLAWSKTGPTYLATYKAIQGQYKLAEISLATYYERRLHMNPTEAKSTAKNVLDETFRNQFTFHRSS